MENKDVLVVQSSASSPLRHSHLLRSQPATEKLVISIQLSSEWERLLLLVHCKNKTSQRTQDSHLLRLRCRAAVYKRDFFGLLKVCLLSGFRQRNLLERKQPDGDR